MSIITKESLESILQQLKCHFTWNLIEGEESLDEFENRVFNKDEFQNNEFKATMCNILAYIKHCRGQNEAALECLDEAVRFIKQQHPDQAEIRSLVTWGNYAWVHYHMNQLSKAQDYVEKVRKVCEKFSAPYRIESPELDCEEGWARLKCTRNQNQRVKVCFEKALEKDPKNPEFTSGWAITNYRLDCWPALQDPIGPLREAIRLDPDNQYVKVLLALKLQKMHEVDEGRELIQAALRNTSAETDVLRCAAKFYQKTGALDRAIEVLGQALECLPNNAYVHYHIGCCYRSQLLQMRDIKEREMKERRKKLTELAVSHLKEAKEINGSLNSVCSYLAGLYAVAELHEEADYYYQKEFQNELAPAARQLLHLRYGNFQFFQRKCEDKAIHHFMEGVKIKLESKEKEKMKNKLQKLAQRRLSENETDSKALHILMFLEALNGERQQAEDAERDMDSASLVPSVSLEEAGNEE
ncbi:interferon-induced protein with tetratricopeptide repeats 2 [Nannospalax galili]|uniref:interferon-induced protein with tetratricopeptide repeats 2 n=1 Tax=Nannospalax galili TaxID=1026970 RepID=UPI0004ED438C|nr:interferon-induced protein with tetratricopeptide repeats 2 [Nannospalax galili]